MITEAILSVLSLMVQGLNALFPSVTFGFEGDALDGAEYVATALGFTNNWFPMFETSVLVQSILTLFVVPILLPFIVTKFVYAHLPIVGRS